MEVKIKEKKRNELLKRNEVIAEVEEKTIPSKQQIREKIAALTNSKPEAMVIQQIKSNFGSPKAQIIARIYDTEEEMKKSERKYVRERNFGKEKKADAAASGPEAPPANFKK